MKFLLIHEEVKVLLEKILRGLITIAGVILGYFVGDTITHTSYIAGLNYYGSATIKNAIIIIISILIFGVFLFLISPVINHGLKKLMDYIEKSIQKLSITEIIFGSAGAIVGLILSAVFVTIVDNIPIVGSIVAVFIAIFMAAVGANICIKRREEIMGVFSNIKRSDKSKDKKTKGSKGDPKVLDTSVIIDGRIFDICQTGFVEGSLIIPTFVLAELRHIADSSDSLKRNRGRRGLDVLNKIQKELNIEVQISDRDFPDISEVDSKLLKLAQVLNGKVVTNDYNLNKVAEFHGVPVLNINELANAVKPVVLPGEEMRVQIIKDGKESGQGVAYLDDGTMIVVEGGRRFIGETKDVIVTSVLQTAAGRMIFAKQKDEYTNG
jgi:uncharacterized protein YacL